MKKIILILVIALIVPVLSACTAQVAGKYDDYNEMFSGTIDLDMQGNGYIEVVSEPSGIECKGKGWLTHIPASSFFTGRCKGQQGQAKLRCSDGRVINGEWTCKSCTTIYGSAISSKEENVTFYITPKKKKIEKIKQQYKMDIENNPPLPPTKKRKMSKYYKSTNALMELF